MIQYIKAQPYQRIDKSDRLDYHNGYYCRNLNTTFGPVGSIAIPRSRKALFRQSAFERYQRRQEAVNTTVLNAFLWGISTRDVAEALKPLLNTTISALTVSRITKRLNPLVKEFY